MGALKIILAITIIIILWVIVTYNRLIKLKNRVKEAWSDIDVQLKRRYNLIPDLVETVKGYAGHEKEVFEKVTQARTGALKATNIQEKKQAENILSQALKNLFAVSENYPQLKAAKNFLELQRELRDTEDKIQAARRFYNANVRDYNIKIESFPAKIIASLFKFKTLELFEIKEEKAKNHSSIKF